MNDSLPLKPRNSEFWMLLGIGAAVIVGAVLRWYAIGAASLWYDEGYTAWVTNHAPAEIIRLIRADTAPPLYYLLLHGWCDVFGRSETALRGFSASFGTLLIPLVALIARKLLKNPLAIIAATWMFALSFMQIQYSQETRAYELTSFLVALMFYCLVSHLQRPSLLWLAGIGAGVVAGLYANNAAAPYAIALGAAWVVLPSPQPLRRRLRDGLLVAVCAAIAYAPWLLVLRSQFHRVDSAFWISRPTLITACETFAELCGVRHFWSWDHIVAHVLPDVRTSVPYLTVLILLCGLATIALLRGRSRRAAIGLAVLALLPPLLMLIYSLWKTPIFLDKTFLASTAIFPLLIAGPLVWATSPIGRRVAHGFVALAIVLSAANALAFVHEQSKEDWRTAAAIVAEMPAAPHRLIIFVGAEAQLSFDYYYSLRAGEVETGAPSGFFAVYPPQTLHRVMSDADLATLRRQIESGKYDDFVLVASHTGWIDRKGELHPGYSDPRALTVQYVLSATHVVQRVDVPMDAGYHDLTIWRCEPKIFGKR